MERSRRILPPLRRTGGIAVALALLALAGCGDYSADYPDLMPTDQLLAEPALLAHAAGSAQSPLALETALATRAESAGHRAAPRIDTGDLAVRAKALQARAKTLSQTPMGDADTGCTLGPDDCPAAAATAP